MTRLVLASASPRRRALLRAAGRAPDEVRPAAVDETPRPDEDAPSLALRLAAAKRDAVVAALVHDTPHDTPHEPPRGVPDEPTREPSDAAPPRAPADDHRTAVVLAADTVVACDARLLGKPSDDGDAAAMLRRLAGGRATVCTGLAIGALGTSSTAATLGTPSTAATLVTTTVVFRDLTDADVAAYVATGEPRGVAGGFRLQGAGAGLVDRTEGCPSSVVGLPVCATRRLLADRGIVVPATSCGQLVADLADPTAGAADA